ncbi:MAG: hypothetical protein AcusKO_00930 [Acuticoccus sp.]
MSFWSVHFGFNERLVSAQMNAPPLKVGDFGYPVRLVQQALIDLGYRDKLKVTTAKYGTPDGLYGNETREAVRKFQTDQSLASKDGIVGEKTITRMDKLLVDRKIPFRGLPPLPPGARGDSKDDESNARLVVLGALGGSNPLRNMNWHFEWHQLSTDTVHAINMTGRHYDVIAQGVHDLSIGVQIHSGITAAAFYVPKVGMVGIPVGVPANTFVVSRPLRYDFRDRALIVHEATHAVCDLRARTMNAFFSELVAFVAEAIFCRKTMGRAKSSLKVHTLSYEIAEEIIAGRKPDNKLIDNLSVNLRSDPTYGIYTHGTVDYDGIPL